MIERETVRLRRDVTLYFDPICPWTWITSRWLLEVADERSVHIDWRPLSLAVLNGGVENMPERFREAGRFSMRVLRMIEAMIAAGRHDPIGPFYTVAGTRLHVLKEQPGQTLLENAAREAGVRGYLVAADDSYWDGAVERSTNRAVELAGPDVGSPVLHPHWCDRGMYGPIVSPQPSGADATRLWDTVVHALEVPGFYELKHGRNGAPEIATRKDVAQVSR